MKSSVIKHIPIVILVSIIEHNPITNSFFLEQGNGAKPYYFIFRTTTLVEPGRPLVQCKINRSTLHVLFYRMDHHFQEYCNASP